MHVQVIFVAYSPITLTLPSIANPLFHVTVRLAGCGSRAVDEYWVHTDKQKQPPITNFITDYWLIDSWNFRTRELSFPGMKVPEVELLSSGTFVPWNFRSRELLFPDTGNYWALILTYSAYSSAEKAPILCHSLDESLARVSTGSNNNKNAQLLLEKKHYNLYSSCCSTDLQGHPSLIIFISSERAKYG